MNSYCARTGITAVVVAV